MNIIMCYCKISIPNHHNAYIICIPLSCIHPYIIIYISTDEAGRVCSLRWKLEEGVGQHVADFDGRLGREMHVVALEWQPL